MIWKWGLFLNTMPSKIWVYVLLKLEQILSLSVKIISMNKKYLMVCSMPIEMENLTET